MVVVLGVPRQGTPTIPFPREAAMDTVRFVGIDPETPGGKCPAVFRDEGTGDFLFQGWTVTDPDLLRYVAAHSPITDHESVVRLPARMQEVILNSLGDMGELAVEVATIGNISAAKAGQPIRFIGIDSESPGGPCPAVFVDEEAGDFLFQGRTVTNPAVLAQVDSYSPIADYESVVRLPARMRAIILEAISVAKHATVGGPANAQ
jgi:hypothetical protein